MTPRFDLGAPVDTATDRSLPGPIGTWTIDHAHSGVALTWRRLRLGTVTGRLHCLGIIHLDDLPPVGVVRFQQPSGLPVLTMALDPASVGTGDARLDTRLCGPDAFDVTRHRWWTLRSESLELLPTGIWRLTATLTARGTADLVELRSEAEASDHDTLVLRGRGVLDRGALGLGKPPWTRSPGSGSTWSCTPDEWSPTAAPNSRGCRSLRGGRVKNGATSSWPVVGSSSGS